MELRELGPDDRADIDRLVDQVNRCASSDTPWAIPETPYRIEMEMRHGFDGEPGRHYLAVDSAGEPCGYGFVFTSDYDNPDLAWTRIVVDPARRRQGLGRELADLVLGVCRSRGRSIIGSDGCDAPELRAAALALGFEQKSQAACRRHFLRELPAGLIEGLYDDAMSRASSYELVLIAGSSPPELVEEIAEVSRAINDAPIDDLDMEDEVYTAARVRAYETAQAAGGWRLYRVLARERRTGELAGHSALVVDAERPHLGAQHDTAVARDHRGHRLGLALKAGMVRWLAQAEPQLETVDTWNAESNDHMVAVNELLGYRVVGRVPQMQRRI